MADLDALWLGQTPDRVNVQYWSDDPPGDPAEFQTAPPYFYQYRVIPSRKPLPRGETSLIYDVTVVLKRGETIIKEILLGESPAWKGRRDPQLAFNALPDVEANEIKRRNLAFEMQEEWGFNDGLEGVSPPGDIYPPFVIGHAVFSESFTVDADNDTLIITAHGLTTGDGEFRLIAGDGELPTGAQAGKSYWAIVFDANQIKLATTKQNALDDIFIDLTDNGIAHATRLIRGKNHWDGGVIEVPNFQGKSDIAVETDSLFFEPFDTSDTVNYKVTAEPLYTADEVVAPDLLKLEARNKNYLLLVPQWTKVTITFTAYGVIKWASPNHRIGLHLFSGVAVAPIAVLEGAGAGNVDDGFHNYAVAFVTASGETKAGAAFEVQVIDKTANGQVRISNIEQGPPGTVARKLYRTTANDTVDEYRDNFFLVTTIANNDPGEEFVDNLADASLGAASPNEYPWPIGVGVAKVNDWFFMPDDDTFDLDQGGDPSVTKDAGFYWCDTDGGADWDSWTFCAADAVTPPANACFSYDKVRYRVARFERDCTIEFYKKMLCRPVFPDVTAEYSESAFTPGFRKLAIPYADGIDFESEDDFVEAGSPTLESDDYESVVITEELTDPKSLRALAWWAENSGAFQAYFNKQYLVDLGLYADLESTEIDGQILADIAGVDASFDFSQTTTNFPDGSSDHILILPENYGTAGPSHYWSKNGLLSVSRANTPAGSLVGALQVSKGDVHERFYIWRKTASTGRTAAIATNKPFSTQAHLELTGLTANRRRIRDDSDNPPSPATAFDYSF